MLPVAAQRSTEPVRGALWELLRRLRRALAWQGVALSNEDLETTADLHPLIDGVDAALIDLMAEEIGEEDLLLLAAKLAADTFAATQADQPTRDLLDDVIRLRCRRLLAARDAGRLSWVRATGARLRLVDAVVDDLIPRRQGWDDIAGPLDPTFVDVVLQWAWEQSEVRRKARDAYRIGAGDDLDVVRASFVAHLRAWLAGDRFQAIAEQSGRSLDETLRIHTEVVAYSVQTVVEQATGHRRCRARRLEPASFSASPWLR